MLRLATVPLLAACVGHLTLGANVAIEPKLLLPGATLKLELDIEGDGLLGDAMRRELIARKFADAPSGAGWQIQDASDSKTYRLRAVSVRDFVGSFEETSLPGTSLSGLHVESRDYVILRTYRVRVTLPPADPPTFPAPRSDLSPLGADIERGTVLAALESIRYDWSTSLPGTVRSTNGLRADEDGRSVWHLDFTSQETRVLDAESLYIDVPRVVVLIGVMALAVFAWVRTRWRTRVGGVPAGPAAG